MVMIKKMLSRDIWEEVCEGFHFTSCAIRSDNVLYLIERESLTEEISELLEDSDIKTRVICLFQATDNDELGYAFVQLDGLSQPKVGVTNKPSKKGLVGIQDINGGVLSFGTDGVSTEEMNPGQLPFSEKLKCIDGYAWSVGSKREIYQRIDEGMWIIKDSGLSHRGKLFDIGFKDIDGFSLDEIYAVGGKGDIWNFDGNIWNKCGFPTNDKLVAVCCTKNETYVYSESIGLWKGKEHNWELVFEFDLSDSSQVNMRWFKDKLWIVHDYGILIWDGENLQDKVIYQDGVLPLRGKLDANKNMLVIANLAAVWTFDGDNWFEVVRPYNLYDDAK